ncbi:MAG: hypothetical protein V1907_02925 [Candidatus Kerfeldbacteria bacterium]
MLSITVKQLLGSVSVVIAIVAFIPYFRDTIAKRTTPHPFTWFIWALIGAIVFIAQVSQGGGAGSWSSGAIAISCLVIFVLSVRHARRPFVFPVFDWIALCSACVAIVLWKSTNDPTGAVVLVSIADSIGYIPTFRKSVLRPMEESMSLYILTILSDIIAIAALEHYSIGTTFYPAMITVMSASFVLFLLRRRATVSRMKNPVQ